MIADAWRGRLLSTLLFLAALPRPAGAAETVYLDFSRPADPSWFDAPATSPAVAPPDGLVVVGACFNDSRFAVDSLNQITLKAPPGWQIPLTIDRSSVVTEFNRIVSLRFYFMISQTDAADAPGAYTLRWGPDVVATNTVVPGFVFDRSAAAACRELSWQAKPSESAESSLASIEVIADSHARYYSLWYLLPMALIFLLLTLRKIKSDDRPT